MLHFHWSLKISNLNLDQSGTALLRTSAQSPSASLTARIARSIAKDFHAKPYKIRALEEIHNVSLKEKSTEISNINGNGDFRRREQGKCVSTECFTYDMII